MSKRNSIGHDPLDWIGLPPATATATTTASPATSKSSTDTKGKAVAAPESSADRKRPESIPSRRAPISADREAIPARRDAASDDREVSRSDDDSAALERELLLMEVKGLKKPRRRRRKRSNRVLLLLVFAFLLCGVALLFFEKAQKRWDNQVATLQSTIDRLESDTRRTQSIYRSALASKDAVIGEKKSLIRDLRDLHEKSLGEVRRSWERVRELQESYARFFTVIFSTRVSSGSASDEDVSETTPAENGTEPEPDPGAEKP